MTLWRTFLHGWRRSRRRPLEAGLTSTVYEDEFVRVMHKTGDGKRDRLLVTFNSHIPAARMRIVHERPLRGGWETEADGDRLPTLYFVEKQNVWFNFPSLHHAIEKARHVRRQYEECTAVGASLGAHAAIRLSRRLRVDTVIAVSPQYCIRPSLVGHFEKRWREDARKIEVYDDAVSKHTVQGDIYIIVDNEHPIDWQHVEHIRSAVDLAALISLPHSGHSSARALADLGQILPLLRVDKANARQTMSSLQSCYQQRWRESPTAVRVRAERLPLGERLEFLESCRGVSGRSRHMADLEAFIAATREQMGRSA